MYATNDRRQDVSFRTYRPDIDGLRAVAILGVVLYHARLPFLTGGLTGVDIFFVISGYLIGGHIYAELATRTFTYVRFYHRRAKRILPAFFCVLLFVMAASLALLSPSELTTFSKTALAATLSASNLLFWKTTNYFNPTNEFNPLLMTWSLGVEEQFYLVIPVVMAIVVCFRRGLLLPVISGISGISFILACTALSNHATFVFYTLPPRAWELGVGVMLAVAEMDRARPWITARYGQISSFCGVLLMLLSMLLIKETTPFPGAAALPAVLGAALVVGSPGSSINRRILSSPLLVRIGRVSYSWYLWHWPSLVFAHILLGDTLTAKGTSLTVAGSFLAAVATYHLVEQPFRTTQGNPQSLLLRYGLVSLAFVAAFSSLWVTHGLPKRFTAITMAEADLRKSDFDLGTCSVPDAMENWRAPQTCYGPKGDNQTVAVWGDSHARALAPGLQQISVAQGKGFLLMVKDACPPLSGASLYDPQIPLDEAACSQFNQEALNFLKANRKIRIVILVGFWEFPFRESVYGQGTHRWWLTTGVGGQHDAPTAEASRKIFTDSLRATITSLRNAGKKVVVVGDVPNFDFDPLLKLRTMLIPARHVLSVSQPDDGGLAAQNAAPEAAMVPSYLREVVSEFPDIQLIEPKSVMCPSPRQCFYRVGDQLLYSDSHHLSPLGARYALRNFLSRAPADTRASAKISGEDSPHTLLP